MTRDEVGAVLVLLVALLGCKKESGGSEASAGASCAKAMACCKAMSARSGSSAALAACDNYAKQSEAVCGPALAQFEQSAKALGFDCGGAPAAATTSPPVASQEPDKPAKPAEKQAVTPAKEGKLCGSQADCPGLVCCRTPNGMECTKGCTSGRICTSDKQCPKGMTCEEIGLMDVRACEGKPEEAAGTKTCPAGQKAVKGVSGELECMTPCDPAKTFCGNGPMRCEPFGPDKVPVCQ